MLKYFRILVSFLGVQQIDKQIEKTVNYRQRIRMLLTQHRFPCRKCLSMHLFGFFIFALAAQHPGQIIHTR